MQTRCCKWELGGHNWYTWYAVLEIVAFMMQSTFEFSNNIVPIMI